MGEYLRTGSKIRDFIPDDTDKILHIRSDSWGGTSLREIMNRCKKTHYNSHVNTMLFRPITYGQSIYSGVIENKKPIVMTIPSSFRSTHVPIISRGGFGSSSIMSVGG